MHHQHGLCSRKVALITSDCMIQVLQYYYPETAHKMYLVNAPFVFRAGEARFPPLSLQLQWGFSTGIAAVSRDSVHSVDVEQHGVSLQPQQGFPTGIAAVSRDSPWCSVGGLETAAAPGHGGRHLDRRRQLRQVRHSSQLQSPLRTPTAAVG